MHDTTAWSISLGRWGGVRVRLHALFLLFGVLTVYLSTLGADRDLVAIGLASLGILFVSVLLHEFAHCYAARRVGGRVGEIVLGPFGGLLPAQVPHDPRSELCAALAGPALNLLLVLATAPPLLLIADNVHLLGLLHPLRPERVVEGSPQVVFLKLAFWLNWLLLLVNLLPAFPFDGGRVLRALLWPAFGYRPAIMLVGRVAKLTAVALCLVAWLTRPAPADALAPAWLPLVLIAMFLFFSAKQEAAKLDQQELGDDLFSYDFSEGYTSLERDAEEAHRPAPGPVRRWLLQRRAERARRRREAEAAEESRVDDILARLHAIGMNGLSSEDRALLQRVSARYRNRTKP